MIEESLIRERAHSIWEGEGRPAGRAEAHWALAQTQIAAETGRPAPRPARKAAAATTPVRRSRKTAKPD